MSTCTCNIETESRTGTAKLQDKVAEQRGAGFSGILLQQQDMKVGMSTAASRYSSVNPAPRPLLYAVASFCERSPDGTCVSSGGVAPLQSSANLRCFLRPYVRAPSLQRNVKLFR